MNSPHRILRLIGLAVALIVIVVPTVTRLNAAGSARPLQTHDFTDVPVAGKEFMEPFINEFYHQGVTTGCKQTPLEYCPEQNVTRGEMAVFIGRALGYVSAEQAEYNTKAYFYNPGLGSAHGVIGRSFSGRGVYGLSITGVGVVGDSTHEPGVSGNSINDYGVFAGSTNNYGLLAISQNETALFAANFNDSTTDTIFDIELAAVGEIMGSPLHLYSSNDVVIHLDHDDSQVAAFDIENSWEQVMFSVNELGQFTMNGDVTVNGDHDVIGGTKSAIVDTVHYGTRKLYAVESTEIWFEDFGSAQLVNGEVVIEIDPMFAETVNLDEEYHVFLTPIGEVITLGVVEQTSTSFTVRADRHADIRFSYRIVAKRLGYEDVRLEQAGDS